MLSGICKLLTISGDVSLIKKIARFTEYSEV